jgi:nucleoside-diphosphate-sugar epimerase
MKVLFLGGSGIISSACTELAVDKDIELFHFNRGQANSLRPVPESVRQVTVDIRNVEEVQQALKKLTFDAVVDWISYTPEQLKQSLNLLSHKTKQYVFISSASAYQTPPAELPVTEKTPLDNPFWQYSRDKIACEKFLVENAKKHNMIYTIVRPSHTYDKTSIPVEGGYTVVNRMLSGKPVLIHGDGTSIWTLTYHRDFAKGLVGLLDNSKAMDETFHITSDELLTWDQIYGIIADAFGTKLKAIHVPSEVLAKYEGINGPGILGDKSQSMIFDNSKIKSVVPEFQCNIKFRSGAKEIASWHQANKSRLSVNHKLDSVFDQIINDYHKSLTINTL